MQIIIYNSVFFNLIKTMIQLQNYNSVLLTLEMQTRWYNSDNKYQYFN